MKPRILIAMHYMELGGAESALLGLLMAHNPHRAELDLFLYAHRGALLNLIPKEKVNVLPEIPIYSMLEAPIKDVFLKGYIRLAFARLIGKIETKLYSLKNKNGLTNVSGLTYQEHRTSNCLPIINPNVEYDLAISFNNPHYIIVNKIKAKKRLGWIHTDYSNIFLNREMELKMWNHLDFIISISDEVGKRFLHIFPSLKEKVFLIENILSCEFIRKRANEFEPMDMEKKEDVINLLSIGRFSYPKRFDEIGTICRLMLEELKIRKFNKNVIWNIIGYGSAEEEIKIRKNIDEECMQNHVKILGEKNNPYPYIRTCDIYVQPSRYEGKSITVREAQILKKPVLIDNYPTACSQITDGKDGVIVPSDLYSLSKGLASFIVDYSKQANIINYLDIHDFSNESEIEKIYSLI